MIHPTEIEEFKEIIKADYQVTLNDFEASRMAYDLLAAIEAVVRPTEVQKTIDKEPGKEQK